MDESNWDEMVNRVKAIVADWDQQYRNVQNEEYRIELGKGLNKAYKVLSNWDDRLLYFMGISDSSEKYEIK
jgi:DNA-binding ferritin-like protein (Dps family)